MSKEFSDLGGWQSFKSGEWIFTLVHRAFRNYWEKADHEYFRQKYPKDTTDRLAKRLISLSCKNAAAIGAATGVAMSTNEVVALLTGAEGGVGLPANIAVAVASLGGEMIGVTHIQLKLIADMGRLYDVPLDVDDPEDVWTILAYALGGNAAELAGGLGMKVGKTLGVRAAKAVFGGARLKAVQKLGKTIGIKILQKSIVKYTAPVVSVVIGSSWNYVSTRTLGKVAQSHFQGRAAEWQAPGTSGAETDGNGAVLDAVLPISDRSA